MNKYETSTYRPWASVLTEIQTRFRKSEWLQYLLTLGAAKTKKAVVLEGQLGGEDRTVVYIFNCVFPSIWFLLLISL